MRSYPGGVAEPRVPTETGQTNPWGDEVPATRPGSNGGPNSNRLDHKDQTRVTGTGFLHGALELSVLGARRDWGPLPRPTLSSKHLVTVM